MNEFDTQMNKFNRASKWATVGLVLLCAGAVIQLAILALLFLA